MPSIEVSSLSKRFGDVVAVDDLSFSASPGHVTGFLGPNGAGKTTTLRSLLGLVTPTSGRALINGVEYRDLTDPARVVGAVLEATGFHPGRSARNHLEILATQSGVAHKRVKEVLDLVGLAGDGDRRVGGFSMGMRQRLELASAMLGEPEVLILDEPANGLDPQGIAWLRSFLRWYAGEGRIVLVSSHLLAEAQQTVDEVIILTHGRLATQGNLKHLLDNVKTEVQISTTQAQRLVDVLSTAGVAVTRQSAETVVASGADAKAIGQLMADNRIPVFAMSSSGESLEELFFSLTEQGGPESHLGWGDPQGAWLPPTGEPPPPAPQGPVVPAGVTMPPPPPAAQKQNPPPPPAGESGGDPPTGR
ncbi:MAG: ATP-binding cassette domain-containing protein [Acidimicrobiales bacterium]